MLTSRVNCSWQRHNDQHRALGAGFGVFTPASDQSSIAQGDNFLARIVPLIMASHAYQDGGLIVLWWDESEGGDTLSEKLPFTIISKDAHKNAGGKPYASSFEFSHSSFVRTMQEILRVGPSNGFQWLGDALIKLFCLEGGKSQGRGDGVPNWNRKA